MNNCIEVKTWVHLACAHGTYALFSTTFAEKKRCFFFNCIRKQNLHWFQDLASDPGGCVRSGNSCLFLVCTLVIQSSKMMNEHKSSQLSPFDSCKKGCLTKQKLISIKWDRHNLEFPCLPLRHKPTSMLLLVF